MRPRCSSLKEFSGYIMYIHMYYVCACADDGFAFGVLTILCQTKTGLTRLINTTCHECQLLSQSCLGGNKN